ncbi:MAG: hypothetical protein H3C35_06065 [Bacteroidetes bacterium]|nr:hypothetical protein [Bacteroidota bacterium]
MQEIINKKIYEMDFAEFDIEFITTKMAENPNSPLFARLADLYIGVNKANEAQKLCEEGIKLFPDYYAGHLVLGKTYLHFHEYSQAKICLERALELSPFNQTIQKFLKELPAGPDLSTRVNDETYFTPQENISVAAEEQSSAEPALSDAELTETSAAQSPPADEPLPSLFDIVSEEEQTVEEEPASEPEVPLETTHFSKEELPVIDEADEPEITEPMIEEHAPVLGPETLSEPILTPVEPSAAPTPAEKQYTTGSSSPAESIGSFDDYFARHIDEVTNGAKYTLDDYLNNRLPSATHETASASSATAHAANEIVHEEIQELHSEPSAEEEPASPFAQPLPEISEEPKTNFDELAEKLQNAERIKPQEQYESPQPPKPEEEAKAYETDMVTPTLAEIYASQGEFNAAIQAYEILMLTQPENVNKYQQRVAELQQKQLEKEGLA